MRPRNRLVRLARALSGETQKDFGEKTGVHPILLAQYEQDQVEPGPENLERIMRGAGLTVADGEEILRFADTLRQPRQRAGQGEAGLSHELLTALVSSVHRRLLRLPVPGDPPTAEDRIHAGKQSARLQELTEGQALAVIGVAREFHNRALAERLWEESAAQASHDAERAASLARLAGEIASESWSLRRRISGPPTATCNLQPDRLSCEKAPLPVREALKER